MRILILSQTYPPEPNNKLRDLTQHLADKKHRVSVVTTFPSYPLGRVYDGFRLTGMTHSRLLSASITRVFAVPYRGAVKSKRMVSYFSFAIAAFLLGLLPRRRPDVIYAFHPPLTTGLAAAFYSHLTGTPFVYDVQDLWPEAIVAAGMLREGSALYQGIRWMENFVYKRARHITVLSEGMKKNLLSKGVPDDKITVIPNWGDPDLYRPLDSSEKRAQLGWKERFVVMIAGNLGLTHGLETIVEAAARLGEHPEILIVFVGAGAAKPDLMARTEALGLKNVQFHDQVPPAEAVRLINAADAMLVHLKEGEFSVPHRIFSYMLCGKPIVTAATGNTAELIESLNCGWLCPPSNPEALAEALIQIASDPKKCAELGRNGLSIAQGSDSRDALLPRIEQIILAARR